jgi:hypothetical protein
MPHLSFSELIKLRVPLTAEEAVALTLAAAYVLDTRRVANTAVQVPGDEFILLGNTGHVTFTSVEVSTDQDESTALAALLRRLLQLDESGANDRRGRVPGGLLILLARTLRQIDLPSPDRDEFRAALARFATEGGPTAAMLSVVFWRAASLRPVADTKRRVLGLLSAGAATSPDEKDRRSHGLSRTELRRALRDLEREVFERPVPDVEMTEPDVATTVPDVEMTEPDVATTLPDVAMTVPDVVTTEPDIEMAEPDIEMAEPDVEMAEPDVETTAPAVAAWLRESRGAVAGALVGAALVAIIAGSGVLDRAPDRTESILAHLRAARDRELGAASEPRSVPVLTRALVGRDVFSPSFDPRGDAIYFHAGRTAAPLMRAAMTHTGKVEEVSKLLDDGAANYHVTMSPSGEMIAYDSDREGVRGVYVADSAGQNARRISGPGYASVPSWSPDGRRLAFVRAEPDRASVWNVWIANVGTGALQRVTSHTVGQPWGASWFPDGRRLAYSREQQLAIIDLQTGQSTVIASPRRGHLVRTPAVSPDGSRVVFQVQRDGAWILDVPRMTLRRILPDPSAEEFVWSPNGRTIAYHARSGDGWGVWTIGV